MREPKSANRFAEPIQVLQELVPWPEQTLLTIGENLLIIAKKDKVRIGSTNHCQ
jgi:acetone carboxylase gamma subunit